MSFCKYGLAVAVALSSPAFSQSQTEQALTLAIRYNLNGKVTGTIAPDPDGPSGPLRYPAMRNTFDSRGLLVRTEHGELSSWLSESVAPQDWSTSAAFTVFMTNEFFYDEYGFEIKTQTRGVDGAIEALVQKSYDARNKLHCKAVRMNPAGFSSPPSEACSLGVQGKQGPDRITRYTYDDFDQVLTEVRALGVGGEQQAYQTNTYNGRLLTSQTDANGNRTELQHDSYGRLYRRLFPSATTPGSVNPSDYNEYAYEKNGNLRFERKRNGASITYTYDATNRLVTKDLSDNSHSPDTYYGYDLRGLLLHSTFTSDGGAGERNAYNSFGDLTSRTVNVGSTTRTLEYRVDEDSNILRLTYPDGYFFEYTYDNLDRVTGMFESLAADPTAAVSSLLDVTYGAEGRLQTIARTNGVTTSMLRDNALRLDSFSQNASGSSDDLSNVFSYNAAGQISQLEQSNAQYTYRESMNRTGAYAVNGLNQYDAIAGQPITHDSRGNLTNDGEVAYTYDMENRLVSASGSVGGASVNANFTWDPLGRLARMAVGGVTTDFLYDGSALIAEYVGGALSGRYVHSTQVDQPLVQYSGAAISDSARRFLLSDQLGSVIAVANNTGNIVNKMSYDSFGIPAAGNVGRFGFTGRIFLKELGLYHYKARVYSPRIGRYLQTDPIFYQDDMNLYAYVGGDPLNNTDPLGLEACPADDNKCVDDLKSETHGQAPPGGHPVTEQMTQLDAVHVTTHKQKMIGREPINFDLPYPKEQYGAIDQATVTAVEGKQERKFKCTDGTSGASNILNNADFVNADAALHTHPKWSQPIPGPDDGLIPARFGIANYGISPRGAWVVERTPSGFRARLIAGSWGGSRSDVRDVVRGYNIGNGKGLSTKTCTYQ